MSEQTQTLQALLLAEAERWDAEAEGWEDEGTAETAGEYRVHAARLRKLAAEMADRVVVRMGLRKHESGSGCVEFELFGIWSLTFRDITVEGLQRRLTDEGRGWPGEGDR